MKLTKIWYLFILLFACSYNQIFTQAPTLGTAATYSVFTSAGDFHNYGISYITGDIGTNVGILDGFPPGIIVGTIHIADPATVAASIDLGVAYADLATRICNNVIGVTLGNGQVLPPGVYCTGAASTLNGNLTFDGVGDPGAIFIIQVNGAFATTVLSTITLINGASACNIYWQINGAFALHDFTIFKGTVIANGAISLHTGVDLEGRALSVAGAISIEEATVCTRINPPTIICPSDITVACAADVPPANVGAVITTDVCGGTPTVTVAADVISNSTCPNQYTITRVYTAKDACGNTNTCTQTITVNDNLPPSISCPANITVSCPDDVPAPDVAQVTSTDNCSGVVLVTVAPDVITGIIDANNYTIQRTYTSTDICGNSVSCTQTIIIDETTPFGITCPADITVTCSSDVPAADITTVSTTGNCGGMIVVTVAPDVVTPGSCANDYIITRTYTATDVSENSLSCSQTITVDDNISPTITCPADISVSCIEDVPASDITAVISADNCSGAVIITVAPDVATLDNNGNTVITRIYSVTDVCGNSASCTQTITVTGTATITIACPADLNVSCAGSVPAANVNSVITTGNCGGALIVTVLPDLISGFNCTNNYTITRTYIATDDSGNSVSCSQTITVLDNVAPTISCPASIAVDCGSNVPAINLNTISTSDNCQNVVAVSVAPDVISNNTCANNYTITRTYTATDQCGNTASCTQVITVQDNIAPVFVPLPKISDILCSEMLPVQPVATATDNCGSVTVTSSIDPYVINICSGYVITYRWIAVDQCGNTSEMTRTFTVLPNNQAIVLSSPPQLEDISCDTAFPPQAIVTGSTGCGTVSVVPSVDPYTVNVCQGYEVTYRWIATDQCGNTGQVTRTFAVLPDTEAPLISSDLIEGSVVTIQCNNADNTWDPFTYTVDDVDATDACSQVDVAMETVLIETGICGVSDFISRWDIIWTATDECGNSSSFSIEVKIVDLTPPVFTDLPLNNFSTSCDNIPSAILITASDDCGNAEVTMTETFVDGPCEGSYTIIRKFKASTGDCANSNYFTQNIEVIDDTPPVITFNGFNQSNYSNGDSIDIDCAYMSALQLGVAEVEITNECGTADINFDLQYNQIENCAQTGYIFVAVATWTAEDDCGNISTLVLNFRVKDITPPVIKGVPENICVTSVPPLTNVQITDDCSSVSQTVSDSPQVNCSDGSYYIIRTWIATDDCGNSSQASQTILVNHGSSGPDIINNIPLFQNANINGTVTIESVGGNLYGMPVIDENMFDANSCTGEVKISTVTELIATGDCIADGFLYSLLVTVTATDFCGYSTTHSYFVNIVDTTVPEFLSNNDIIISCGDEIPVPSVFDNSNVAVIITYTDLNNINNYCSGEIPLERLWTAIDVCGNSTSLHQKIHIVDTKGPQLTGVPEDDCNISTIAPVVTAFDECSESALPVSFSEIAEQSQCGPVIVRTWSATDACGNTTSGTQRIFTKDVTPPVIKTVHAELLGKISGDEIELECSKTKYTDMLSVLGADAVSASDNCEADVKIELTIKQTGDGNCNSTGYVAKFEYIWTAIDKCGNTSEFVLNVKFVDHQAPVFTNVPADMILYCEDVIPPMQNALAVDDCFLENITSDQVKTFDDGNTIIYTRSWTAVDICGNSSSVYQKITLVNSTFNCEIILPDEGVECSSVGNLITSTLAGGTGPYTYQWDLVNCDGFILTGQGTDSITVVNGFTTMNIQLTVTDANDCISNCYISLECYNNNAQIGNETTIEGLQSTSSISKSYFAELEIYPNPAQDKIKVRIDEYTNEAVKIQMIDMFGNVVQSVNVDNFPAIGIELISNELSAGVYMIHALQTGKNPLVKKLVVLEF